jgi:hypothetical protein
MIFKYLNPVKQYNSLVNSIDDLTKYKKYKEIVLSLTRDGSLERIGLSSDENGNMYIGIDLNPELLLYSETSKETVELKMISEKMLKYTDYLTKQGIIDFIKVDYDRVKNDMFYGYVIQIGFNFTKYTTFNLFYPIGYFLILISGLLTTLAYIL